MAQVALSEAFESARKEFLRESGKAAGIDISSFTTINDVYDATDKIQQEQSESKALRYLQRFQPYLACINHYAGVVETFAQTKPEIISPIWGCIKAILLIASTYARSYDKIVEVMVQLANSLPEFEKYTEIFQDNDRIKHVLSLFYKDILDFHATILQFFKIKSWRFLLESVWPKYHGKLMIILENVARNKALMDSAVTLKDITEAHQARVDAYAKYEKDYHAQQRCDFEAAKSGLSPNLYYSDLERHLNRCSVKSGDWLHRMNNYKDWIDPKNSGMRLLWLQGIPGAGKTCLSSLLIRQLQTRGDPVAFLFLTYQAPSEISLLKIVHSLIFQLVISNKDLRPLISTAYHENLDQLSTSVEYSTDVIKNILKQLPTTYLVIDGLDEIPECDRPRLLRSFLELRDVQDNVKVLISSRAEQDIAMTLGSKVDLIRIHDGNSQDVQHYVDKRVGEMMSNMCVDMDIKKEFQPLAESIGPNSKGMFLCAKLVCDNLGAQDSLEEMKSEVTNLPDGLDQAYGRIMKRIDEDLCPREREQARTILEWIGCSRVPVTKHEILLALRCRSGDPTKGCQGLLLNILQRCGPIIEEVGGYVEFVHFTAKEYLFGPQSKNYLKKAPAHATIAATCISYLCSNCFTSDLQDQLLKTRIYDGAYVLENYACSYWLEHVRKSAKASAIELTDKLERLMLYRKNPRFRSDSVTPILAAPDLKPFEETSVELYEDLLIFNTFWRKCLRELSLDDAQTLMEADPLAISTAQISVRTVFEKLLCSKENHETDCSCSQLHEIHGSRLYRCSRPGCFRYRNGFETRAERDRHLSVHSRPFKCDDEKCDFFALGFRTEAQLQAHFLRNHQERIATTAIRRDAFNAEAEIELFLFDAIASEDFELVRDLECEASKSLDDCIEHCLKERSSPAMLELLLSMCKDPPLKYSFGVSQSVFRLASPEHLKQLMCHGTIDIDAYAYGTAAEACSPEMFEFLVGIEPQSTILEFGKRFFERLFGKGGVSRMEAALKCLRAIKSKLSALSFSNGLFYVSRSGHSQSIAELCLENGADIEYHLRNSPKASTPLCNVSKFESQQAANFMEYLLRCGANPHLVYKNTNLADRPGPRNISKWFGMDWDEFVKDCQQRPIVF